MIYKSLMIIIWKYQRQSKLRKIHSKWNRTYSYLFDPVIWLSRNHCWIQSDMFRPKSNKFSNYKTGYKLNAWCRYIIIWKIERYIDIQNNEKTSITPSRIWHIWWLSISQSDYIRKTKKIIRKTINNLFYKYKTKW